MSESIIIAGSTKEERYQSLCQQIRALVEGEKDFIANISNIMAVLKYGMNFFWVGIYFVKGNELVLGPFQGPVACTRIGMGKGACGTAWKEKRILVVEDVNKFPGHIACSSDSKSEIVVPILKNNLVFAVLDADSDKLKYFDDIDKKFLEEIGILISQLNS